MFPEIVKKKKIEHIHKLKKIVINDRKVIIKDGKRYLEKQPGIEVFKCIDCPYYRRVEVMEGHKSRCWRCDKELTLNIENMRLKKPTHIECRRIREKI